jgi:hypothetical protein
MKQDAVAAIEMPQDADAFSINQRMSVEYGDTCAESLTTVRMSVIAWRLFWLTHLNRQTPAAPCTTILAAHEWKAVSTTIHRSQTIPQVAPSVRQAVRSLAQLGGFLGLLAMVNPAVPRSGANGHG